MYVYMYTYTHIFACKHMSHTYVYMYVYTERERERERNKECLPPMQRTTHVACGLKVLVLEKHEDGRIPRRQSPWMPQLSERERSLICR